MSLRNRLLVSILATLLLSLVAGGTFTYWHAVAKIDTEMQAAMAVGSRIARNAVDDWEESTDPARRLALLVADFEGDRHLRASLVGPDGKVLLASKVARSDDQAPGWFVSLLAAPPKKVEMDLPEVFDKFGTVVLQTDPRNEVAEVWGDVWLTLTRADDLLRAGACLHLLDPRQHHSAAAKPDDGVRAGRRWRLSRARAGSTAPWSSSASIRASTRWWSVWRARRRRTSACRSSSPPCRTRSVPIWRATCTTRSGPCCLPPTSMPWPSSSSSRRASTKPSPHRVGIIREAIGRMQRHVRDILGRLRSAMLLDVGLAHAIDNLVAFWRVHRRQPQLQRRRAGGKLRRADRRHHLPHRSGEPEQRRSARQPEPHQHRGQGKAPTDPSTFASPTTAAGSSPAGVPGASASSACRSVSARSAASSRSPTATTAPVSSCRRTFRRAVPIHPTPSYETHEATLQ